MCSAIFFKHLTQRTRDTQRSQRKTKRFQKRSSRILVSPTTHAASSNGTKTSATSASPASSVLDFLSSMRHQIQQRIEKNPDHIHEVPVQPEVLHRHVIFGGVVAAPGEERDERSHQNAGCHVHGVQAGHDEIEGEENCHVTRVDTFRKLKVCPGNVVLAVLGVVLEALEPQEGNSEQQCKQQE